MGGAKEGPGRCPATDTRARVGRQCEPERVLLVVLLEMGSHNPLLPSGRVGVAGWGWHSL